MYICMRVHENDSLRQTQQLTHTHTHTHKYSTKPSHKLPSVTRPYHPTTHTHILTHKVLLHVPDRVVWDNSDRYLCVCGKIGLEQSACMLGTSDVRYACERGCVLKLSACVYRCVCICAYMHASVKVSYRSG
jgi:hypothetical protein